MKKTATIFLSLFATGLILGGCIKTGTYTCVCTDVDGAETSVEIENSTKANARLACSAMNIGTDLECELN